MDKHINIYNSVEAYEADSARKALPSPTISDVAGEIVADGKNKETTFPEFGDAVFHDANKKVHFVIADTLDKASLPSDYVFIGACGPRVKGKVMVVHKENTTKKFADVFRWVITGMALDGVEHVSAVVLKKTSLLDFKYTATTIEEFASQLNVYLKDNHPSGYEYSAYVEDDKVMLQMDTYTAPSDTTTMSGMTLTTDIAMELPQTKSPMRRCGTQGNGVWNVERFLTWGETESTNTAYNPDKVLTSIPNYPVVLPAYLGTSVHRDGDKCAYLRSIYGEGREGWERCIRDTEIVYPYANYGASDRYGTGNENTYKLTGKTYLASDGTRKPLYPCAEYVAAKGFDGVEGFDRGDWHGVTMGEYAAFAGKLNLGTKGITTSSANLDKINKTLYKMGVDTLSTATYTWLFSRDSALFSWYANNFGVMGSYYFYASYRSVALALYKI